MSPQWAETSSISTDQKSHEAPASSDLLVLVFYCDKNVLVNGGDNQTLRAVQ